MNASLDGMEGLQWMVGPCSRFAGDRSWRGAKDEEHAMSKKGE